MLPGNAEPQLGLTPYCAKLRLGHLFSHAELGLGVPRGVLVISDALPVMWISFPLLETPIPRHSGEFDLAGGADLFTSPP